MTTLPRLKNLTVKQAVHNIADYLHQYPLSYGQGIASPLDEAAYLVSFVVGLPPDFYLPEQNQGINELHQKLILEKLRARIESREPLAYLLGETMLAGYRFEVNNKVLIPRSPLAELIEQQFSPWWPVGKEPNTILDLCCGSGCLGILAALHFPASEVHLSDIDSKALEVAQNNIRRYNLAERVTPVLSDVYAQLPTQTYDIILSNPPYVPIGEQSSLPGEFHHEPSHALFAGFDGLDIAKKILPNAAQYLSPEGILVLEVGQSASALQQLYPQHTFMWLEFERGGEGVCILNYDECVKFQSLINNYVG